MQYPCKAQVICSGDHKAAHGLTGYSRRVFSEPSGSSGKLIVCFLATMDLNSLQKRIQELRQEISDLADIDKKNRVGGSLVGWHDRTEHQSRLARIQEIKEELEELIPIKR